jgi:hypothetical protein
VWRLLLESVVQAKSLTCGTAWETVPDLLLRFWVGQGRRPSFFDVMRDQCGIAGTRFTDKRASPPTGSSSIRCFRSAVPAHAGEETCRPRWSAPSLLASTEYSDDVPCCSCSLPSGKAPFRASPPDGTPEHRGPPTKRRAEPLVVPLHAQVLSAHQACLSHGCAPFLVGGVARRDDDQRGFKLAAIRASPSWVIV